LVRREGVNLQKEVVPQPARKTSSQLPNEGYTAKESAAEMNIQAGPQVNAVVSRQVFA